VPSGIDLARAALAEARARAREQGRAVRKVRPTEPRHSGSGPDSRDPQPFAAGISRLVAERGWEEVAARGVAIARWPEVVGPEIAAHTTAESCVDGVLVVQAESTSWATQLRLLAATIVKAINTECGHGTVTRIDVRGPVGPSWRKGALRVQDGRGPRDTYG
jgi:predicted nucleic acid-binding Zn ribbon protein